MFSPRGIAYGCTAAFLQLLVEVLSPQEIEEGPRLRNQDYCEVFAGTCNLSHRLTAVPGLHPCLYVFHANDSEKACESKAGFSGHSFDKVLNPKMDIGTREGKLECD